MRKRWGVRVAPLRRAVHVIGVNEAAADAFTPDAAACKAWPEGRAPAKQRAARPADLVA